MLKYTTDESFESIEKVWVYKLNLYIYCGIDKEGIFWIDLKDLIKRYKLDSEQINKLIADGVDVLLMDNFALASYCVYINYNKFMNWFI